MAGSYLEASRLSSPQIHYVRGWPFSFYCCYTDCATNVLYLGVVRLSFWMCCCTSKCTVQLKACSSQWSAHVVNVHTYGYLFRVDVQLAAPRAVTFPLYLPTSQLGVSTNYWQVGQMGSEANPRSWWPTTDTHTHTSDKLHAPHLWKR